MSTICPTLGLWPFMVPTSKVEPPWVKKSRTACVTGGRSKGTCGIWDRNPSTLCVWNLVTCHGRHNQHDMPLATWLCRCPASHVPCKLWCQHTQFQAFCNSTLAECEFIIPEESQIIANIIAILLLTFQNNIIAISQILATCGNLFLWVLE